MKFEYTQKQMIFSRVFFVFFGVCFIADFIFPAAIFAGTLSCSITTAAACTGSSVVILRMSSSTNAHAELPSQSTANYASTVVCCNGVAGLGNSCSGTFAVAAKLQNVTNSHVQQNDQTGYTNNACISVSAGTVSVGYQASSCTVPTLYDTTLASIAAVTNSHIGSPASYTTKICASAAVPSQSLTFSISGNSVGFGNLSSGAARYATGDNLGSATEVEAHQFLASTNASSGYVITLQGATLTSGANTITAIGSTNTASSPGTKQFGLRISASGGTGLVSSPYALTGFAYAGNATTASQVASDSIGDGLTTTYSVRYLANISGATVSGSYSSTLTYVATAGF